MKLKIIKNQTIWAEDETLIWKDIHSYIRVHIVRHGFSLKQGYVSFCFFLCSYMFLFMFLYLWFFLFIILAAGLWQEYRMLAEKNNIFWHLWVLSCHKKTKQTKILISYICIERELQCYKVGISFFLFSLNSKKLDIITLYCFFFVVL